MKGLRATLTLTAVMCARCQAPYHERLDARDRRLLRGFRAASDTRAAVATLDGAEAGLRRVVVVERLDVIDAIARALSPWCSPADTVPAASTRLICDGERLAARFELGQHQLDPMKLGEVVDALRLGLEGVRRATPNTPVDITLTVIGGADQVQPRDMNRVFCRDPRLRSAVRTAPMDVGDATQCDAQTTMPEVANNCLAWCRAARFAHALTSAFTAPGLGQVAVTQHVVGVGASYQPRFEREERCRTSRHRRRGECPAARQIELLLRAESTQTFRSACALRASSASGLSPAVALWCLQEARGQDASTLQAVPSPPAALAPTLSLNLQGATCLLRASSGAHFTLSDVRDVIAQTELSPGDLCPPLAQPRQPSRRGP